MMGLLKNLLFALGLAIVVGVGYIVFVKDSDTGIIDVVRQDSGSTATLQTQEFISKLRALKRIDIEGDVFTDPRFTALTDFRQTIEDGLIPGRPNPFAPVGEN